MPVRTVRGAPRALALRAAGVTAVLASLASCGGGGAAGGPSRSGAPHTGGRLTGTVTVLAAASLQETFTELGGEFEAAHPGVRVRFDFGGSSSLAQSIVRGAPADVFASADTATMRTVTEAGDAAGTPRVFTRNRLEIAVAPGNPGHVRGLRDLAAPGTAVALCAPQVPCGAAARRALAAGGVRLTPVTLEEDVKAALTKVELGEVDAALVYRTDVRAARGKVTGVDFPESARAVNDYPVVRLAHAPDAAAAAAFVALVESPRGRAVLTRAGFEAP